MKTFLFACKRAIVTDARGGVCSIKIVHDKDLQTRCIQRFLTLKAQNTIAVFANTVDLDDTVHNKPHRDLQ